MASDGSKPARGKFPAKAALPGVPGGEAISDSVKRTGRAKTPAPMLGDTVAAPALVVPEAIVPAAAIADLVIPEVIVPKPAPKPAAAPEPAAPEPVAAAPEPVIINPQPTAPVLSSEANTQEDKTMEATMQEATNKTQAFFGDANDRAKTAMEKSSKMFEEMNSFGKGNVEALVESSRIAAKGLETLGQEAAEFTSKQFESTTAIMKSMASVKSPTELFKMQSDFIRQSFDSMVAESSKNTEAMLKLAGEIAQPLSNRVALAAEKAKIAA